MGKLAGIWNQSRQQPQILLFILSVKKKKKPNSLENALGEAIKMTNIKS